MWKDRDNTADVVQLTRFRGNSKHRLLNEVEAYWDGLRQGRPLPDRQQLDPRGLARALPCCFVLERVAPQVMRFRLAGQHLNELAGMEMRGMPFSALFLPEARAQIAPGLERLCDGPQALTLSLRGDGGFGRPGLDGEMVLLPMRGEDGAVNRVLGCLTTEGRIGRQPRRFEITALTARDLAAPVPQKRPDAERPALYLVKS
ncbi:PAS domain-containing protein [Actibacterium sp. XHP0104]|uniref:PAS domain-containing protein n=1 Tax=Actibacterium sp. XHP0104 TaxID=2984335 RepID=UPI0021E93B7B|nr:PAS domain-containing protein [Actibacterium sp. XHP0104]MCV2881103.1 PAS domain-containing protein [Actibacterium sp. XHP0104]